MYYQSSIPGREAIPNGLRSQVTSLDGVMVLRFAGEIDASDVDELEASIVRARGQADGRLILDLEDVSFLDLAGMRAIVRSLRARRAGDCTVSIGSAGPRVRRVFELCGNQLLLDPPASLVDVSIAASVEPERTAGAPDG